MVYFVDAQRTYSWGFWFGSSRILGIEVDRSLRAVGAVHDFDLLRVTMRGLVWAVRLVRVVIVGHIQKSWTIMVTGRDESRQLVRVGERVRSLPECVALWSACLRKVDRRNNLQDQAREERKRCQLTSDVRVHSRRRQPLVAGPVIGFRCARRTIATALPISID